MIFVTVGNARQPFSRLIISVDKLAGEGVFGPDNVIIQAGHDRDFLPKHCKRHEFLPLEEYISLMREANLVICHGGAGTLYHSFNAGKVPIVMPRQKQYCEHVDDNQIDLVRALAATGRIVAAYEPIDLIPAISEARQRRGHHDFLPSNMLALVKDAVERLMDKH